MRFDFLTLAPLFDLSRDAVIGVSGGAVAFANPAAEHLLSVRAGDAAARYIPEHILTDPAERFIASARLGGQSADVSAVRLDDGLLLTVSRRTEPAGGIVGLSDRTLRELGNNLLTTRLALDGLLNGALIERDEKLKSYAAVLYQSYYRMKRLHSHMSLVLNLENGRLPFSPRVIDLGTLCAELCGTVDNLVGELGVTVTFEAQDDGCFINGDAQLLETMLLNLLANSLQHTGAGGAVRMTLARRGDRCVIAVDDTGAGVPTERLTALMQGDAARSLTDPGGAGLGLAVVRGVAERHGGALIAESREGEGTRLRVSLPVSQPGDRPMLHDCASFRVDGLNTVLTELSVVLDKKFYTRRSFD